MNEKKLTALLHDLINLKNEDLAKNSLDLPTFHVEEYVPALVLSLGLFSDLFPLENKNNDLIINENNLNHKDKIRYKLIKENNINKMYKKMYIYHLI